MNIFGIGLPEMAVIAAIALLVFGPKRLPEMGKTLGRTLRGFQAASQEFEQEFRSALRTEEMPTSEIGNQEIPDPSNGAKSLPQASAIAPSPGGAEGAGAPLASPVHTPEA